MHLPAYDTHRATRIGDQSRVRWLSEFLFASVVALALAAALFVP